MQRVVEEDRAHDAARVAHRHHVHRGILETVLLPAIAADALLASAMPDVRRELGLEAIFGRLAHDLLHPLLQKGEVVGLHADPLCQLARQRLRRPGRAVRVRRRDRDVEVELPAQTIHGRLRDAQQIERDEGLADGAVVEHQRGGVERIVHARVRTRAMRIARELSARFGRYVDQCGSGSQHVRILSSMP